MSRRAWHAVMIAAVSTALVTGCDLRQEGHTNPSLRPSWATGTDAASTGSTSTDEPGVQVYVTATIDGDTFRADVDGRPQPIRVLGTNASEVRHGSAPEQCGGEAARTALDRMIWHKTVTLLVGRGSADVDRYGRLLRYVQLGHVDVGLAMIQQGRASEYHPRSAAAESRTKEYAAAQRAATRAHRGQWARCTPAQEQKR